MSAVDPRSLSERELHEYVAEVEGHDSQVTGVVGYFYEMYRARGDRAGDRTSPIATSSRSAAAKGMMFEGTGIAPVQMDVSMRRRAARARKGPAGALRATAITLPFADESFSTGAADRGARAHERAVADPRRGAARAEAGRPRRSWSCRTTSR